MTELNKYYLDQEERNAQRVGCWWLAFKYTAYGIVVYLAYLGVLSLMGT